MPHDSKDTLQFVLFILFDYLFNIFVTAPASVLKSYSRHPLSITAAFFILFPIYLITYGLIYLFSVITSFICVANKLSFIELLAVGKDSFMQNNFNREQRPTATRSRQQRSLLYQQNDTEPEEPDEELQKWMERCSICFESKLDLYLEYCKDQFCLDCFQRYIVEVVKSSWGLSVTKIKCPVCRIQIPQAEWTKFVPSSVTDLYNKFNQPYRNFVRCCPHCETEVTPCDFQKTGANSFFDGRSITISNMIRDFFHIYSDHCTLDQRCDKRLINSTEQNHFVQLFKKSEKRNSVLVDTHRKLVGQLKQTSDVIDQTEAIKKISREILQLEMRPDTWRKLQFDYISFFPISDCPTCKKEFCLQCGHADGHRGLTCEENMKQLILANDSKQTNNELMQTLKWKLENSRKCPSCSIMIHRDEGCNKIECTFCGFSFCWECKASWELNNNCGFFKCANKITNTDDSSSRVFMSDTNTEIRTELGVPNVDFIISRLNN